MYINKYNKFVLLYCAFALLPLAKMTAASNSAGVIDHNSALYSAVLAGDTQEVKAQIQNHNANINMEPFIRGYGLLYSAINFLNDPGEMMQLLIDQGIDKAQYSGALELATQRGAVQGAKCLMENGAEPTIEHMCEAAKNGFADLVKLFAKIVDVNKENQCGKTPIHYAIANRHQEATERLIAAGARVDGKIWATLIYTANIGSVNFLLQGNLAVSNFDSVGTEGYTPLSKAAVMKEYGIMKQLIEVGASLDRVDKDGFNILDLMNFDPCKEADEIKKLLRSKGLLTKSEREALANEKKDTQKPDKELAPSIKYPTPSGLKHVGPALCAVAAIGAAGVWYFYKYRNQSEKKNEQSVATAA